MISRVLKENKIRELRLLLERCENIVITCHVSPDGDAIGSSLAMYHVLNVLGKNVKIVTPDMLPKNLLFLPGAKEIVPFTKYGDFGRQLFANADLIFCLDFNAPYRVDKMADVLLKSKAKKVLIDHHLDPENFADVVISHPEMSSTCLLVFRVLCRLELFNQINKKAAECIYTGMMTDTGNFTYNSEDPDIYIIIAELLKKGINKDYLYSKVCNTHSESRIRLNGYAVSQKMQLFPEHQVALITLTQDELRKYGYEKGDTESLVNIPLSIPEITYSVFMRDDVEYIKVSTRSKGDFAVNRICESYFNGGGHKNAAGGEFRGTLDEAVGVFMSILDENDKYLKK
ncbi:MAG: bifunctional oligoribonuclease/PAP phosphatase NrnA [Muribaculaceae bacterium]|nr:bifunctional oligoribonuclease/PAP phosphatase NrnA [Muribaculaceae bacterium]